MCGDKYSTLDMRGNKYLTLDMCGDKYLTLDMRGNKYLTLDICVLTIEHLVLGRPAVVTISHHPVFSLTRHLAFAVVWTHT